MGSVEMSTKLFIVDDSQEIREILVNYFKGQPNMEVVGEASDGVTALKSIEEKEPDAVIMDVVLTGMDGFSLMEKINALEKAKKPNMFILSALCKEEFVHKALNLGASYYMMKPFSLDTLNNRLKDVLTFEKTTEDVHFSSTQAVDGMIKVYQEGRNNKSARMKAVEERITNIFITVGIPAHIKGYQFLREAIKMAIEQPEIINSITKKLYPSIAAKFETSASKVERAIRHAIEVAWNRGKIENINALFGIKVYSNNEKPTNGEFIALVADKMLLEGV